MPRGSGDDQGAHRSAALSDEPLALNNVRYRAIQQLQIAEQQLVSKL